MPIPLAVAHDNAITPLRHNKTYTHPSNTITSDHSKGYSER